MLNKTTALYMLFVLILLSIPLAINACWMAGMPDDNGAPLPSVQDGTSISILAAGAISEVVSSGAALTSTLAPNASPTPVHAPTVSLIPTPTPADLETSDIDTRVDALLAQMTVEEKVGQLFVVFFDGTRYGEQLERTIRELHVGGILIFQPNVVTVEELAILINAAQSTAVSSGSGIPLFVGVDHEGGMINRFGDKLTQFPSNMAIGATGSAESARAVAHAMAQELNALGINMNLAPVVDVNSNPQNPVIGIRSFGAEPAMVAELGSTMIDEFQKLGIIATAKHFPGHGDTASDSHAALPIIWKEMDQLRATELLPFAAAIDAGADAIMTAHVAVPAVTGDQSLPATLSQAALSGLLRDTMGFTGLIATDSIGMGAIDEMYGVTDATAMAFLAGADLLMFGNDPGHTPAEQAPAYRNLLELVQDGTVSLERLDASVRRILQVKVRYGLFERAPVSVDNIPRYVRTPEHLELSARIAEQSVTLVRNDQGLLPLDPARRILLIYPNVEPELSGLFRVFAPHFDALSISLNPTPEELARVVTQASESDLVVIATVNAVLNPGQAALVDAMQHLPLAVVALMSPYDLLAFPSQQTYLALYGDGTPSLYAATKILFGLVQPSGTLPIPLPGLFPAGHGLSYD